MALPVQVRYERVAQELAKLREANGQVRGPASRGGCMAWCGRRCWCPAAHRFGWAPPHVMHVGPVLVPCPVVCRRACPTLKPRRR